MSRMQRSRRNETGGRKRKRVVVSNHSTSSCVRETIREPDPCEIKSPIEACLLGHPESQSISGHPTTTAPHAHPRPLPTRSRPLLSHPTCRSAGDILLYI